MSKQQSIMILLVDSFFVCGLCCSFDFTVCKNLCWQLSMLLFFENLSAFICSPYKSLHRMNENDLHHSIIIPVYAIASESQLSSQF